MISYIVRSARHVEQSSVQESQSDQELLFEHHGCFHLEGQDPTDRLRRIQTHSLHFAHVFEDCGLRFGQSRRLVPSRWHALCLHTPARDWRPIQHRLRIAQGRCLHQRYSVDTVHVHQFGGNVEVRLSRLFHLFALIGHGTKQCSSKFWNDFSLSSFQFSQAHVRPQGLYLVHFRYSPMPIANFLNSSLTTYYTKIIDDITIISFGSNTPSASITYALSTANFPYSARFQESKVCTHQSGQSFMMFRISFRLNSVFGLLSRRLFRQRTSVKSLWRL